MTVTVAAGGGDVGLIVLLGLCRKRRCRPVDTSGDQLLYGSLPPVSTGGDAC